MASFDSGDAGRRELRPSQKRPPGNSRGPLRGSNPAGAFKRNDPRINRHGCYGLLGKTAAQAVIKKARGAAFKHISTLDQIARDPDQPASARIRAIQLLQERAYGSPTTEAERERIERTDAAEALVDAGDLSTAELKRFLARASLEAEPKPETD